MILELHIGLTLALIVALIFLSTVESAVDELSEVQLRVLVAEHESERHGRLLKEIVENDRRFLLAVSLSSQILIIGLTILVIALCERWDVTRAHALLWALPAMLAIVGLFRQLLPHLLAQRDPDGALLRLLPVLSLIYDGLLVVSYPIYRIIQWQEARLGSALDVGDEDAEEEIQAYIDVGEEEGIIEEAEGHMIQSIVELGDRRVAEVMTPRSEIVAVASETPIRQALKAIIDSKYSRIPVYRDQLDNIEGVVYLRDLLKAWQAGRENDPVGTIARTAHFVPETKSAGELLEEMRQSHTHIALVVDEFGGIAGLITIEDLLEEIVGGIQEETDKENDDIVEQPDGSFLVKGTAEIRKIEELFHTEIEADDFTTVAGFIIRQLKRMPKIGEQVHFKDLLFEVVDADPRRVRRVRIRPVPAASTRSEQVPS
ncbi:MAG: HlyC/CorC family transporter [Acidobacteria bacterium]|nr:MAG: HlyC/CorC family transporter [Acidobacteriota bacterium]